MEKGIGCVHIEILDSDNDNEAPKEKPLFLLIKRLINGHDSQQNTVLTNSQLIDILHKDCDMDTSNMHPLEVDIYMNVLKKFLKHWPQWDKFDRLISNAKSEDHALQDKILDQEYASLQEYLMTIINRTRPLAKETVQKVKETEEKSVSLMDTVDSKKMFMEIQCSREQLNNLFYRYPLEGDQVFHVSDDSQPTKINLNTLTLKCALNLPNICFQISTKDFTYRRETAHKLQHTLINKSLDINSSRNPIEILNQDIQVKLASKIKKVRKSEILDFLKKMSVYFVKNCEDSHLLLCKTLFDTIIDDIDDIPDGVTVPIPATFRKYTNKYPYVRYLYKDVEADESVKEKYDLQLEEKLSPMHQFHIGKLVFTLRKELASKPWLKIECTLCKIRFEGVRGLEMLLQHLLDLHQHEQDWQCTNCKKIIPFGQLTASKWNHKC